MSSIFNEIQFLKLANGKEYESYTTVILENLKINKFYFEKTFLNNIQLLSLKNNGIRDLSFMEYFPNIWHLEIRNNPVSMLNYIYYKKLF